MQDGRNLTLEETAEEVNRGVQKAAEFKQAWGRLTFGTTLDGADPATEHGVGPGKEGREQYFHFLPEPARPTSTSRRSTTRWAEKVRQVRRANHTIAVLKDLQTGHLTDASLGVKPYHDHRRLGKCSELVQDAS